MARKIKIFIICRFRNVVILQSTWKLTNDYFFTLKQGLDNFQSDGIGDKKEGILNAINTCMVKAKVQWLPDNLKMSDFTKCTHYNLCNKTF